MKSIFEACRPRKDLLTGAFNPEIFTANLGAVVDHYRGQKTAISPIYTDPRLFFGEATYPTHGLRTILSEVFGRLKGDNSLPSIHRLETAFGGGKTHALIACSHIAFVGNELPGITDQLVAPELLPDPGEISVAAIRGDELPVHEPRGRKLVPWTLWGEIAYQLGGQSLYKSVQEEATSRGAPGRPYFDAVLGGRKALILLDELAQYAARLEAAQPGGGEQLAAFLMALHGYARTRPGVCVVSSLAGSADAFAKETMRLAGLLSSVKGEHISEDEALSIGQRALGDVQSVVARDASPLVPVQAGELSRVLAQRLFERIDKEAARETAEAYRQLYARSAQLLPDTAARPDFGDRIAATYPFHPTLIDFLNSKLSTVENFQGTRGVLRVLAWTVRNLWEKQKDRNLFIPMVHACHIDLRDARIAAELLGRTGSSDLLPVLNADVGGADTGQLETGRSNAEEADLRNPHPNGYPLYEYTWRTVFLHSLAGRGEGLGSNVFGLTEPDALFTVSFPNLTPPQVAEALEEITRSAFYLRKKEGRYYASTEPSVNHALARIRRALPAAAVREALHATARKVVKEGTGPFRIVPDVSAPEHIPDEGDRPILALITLDAPAIDVEGFITTKGGGQARLRQNLVLMLVPKTVVVRDRQNGKDLFHRAEEDARKALEELEEKARWAVAIRELKKRPGDYGINPARLDEDEFRRLAAERAQAPQVAVAQAYNRIWFPSASGRITNQEIKTGGAEGGTPIVETIRTTLIEAQELLTRDSITQANLINLRKLFLETEDTISVEQLRENFRCRRDWPLLETPDVLDRIVRDGVSHGVWCLFRMGADENLSPEEFYSREGEEVPFEMNLSDPGYSLVTPQGAKQRGWTAAVVPDRAQLKQWIQETAGNLQMATASTVSDSVVDAHGDVPESHVIDALADLIRESRLLAFKGKPEQKEKPKLISGTEAALYTPAQDDVVLTPAKAAEKGWLKAVERAYRLSGNEGARKLVPLLRRIGSLYARGAKSTIDTLDMVDLALPQDARLRLTLEMAPPETLKRLGELFEVLEGVCQVNERTEVYLTISNPADDCPFVKELKGREQGKSTGEES